MAGFELYATKLGNNYVLWENQGNLCKRIFESPKESELYMKLWNIKSGINSIEIGEMDSLCSLYIETALSDFKFVNLVDESGRIQAYLEMLSELSPEYTKKPFVNPAGRAALLEGLREMDVEGVGAVI